MELDVGYNKLNTYNLSGTVIAWLDKYDPGWTETQDISTYKVIIQHSDALNFSLNFKNSSILYNLPVSGNVKLQIFNVKGSLLSTLIDSYKQAGSYKVNCDSKRHGSGVYYIKLSIENHTFVQKADIMK